MITMLALLKLGSTAAGKTAFKKAFDALMSKATQNGIDALSKWKGNRALKVDKVFRHMLKIRMVKTLWQVDHAVDISAFYCDSHILIDGKRRLAAL